MNSTHLPYLWDYDLDQSQFLEILEGRRVVGRLNQDWAARRLLEYAPYEEIIHLIGFKRLVENWPRWRGKIRRHRFSDDLPEIPWVKFIGLRNVFAHEYGETLVSPTATSPDSPGSPPPPRTTASQIVSISVGAPRRMS